MDKKDSNDLEEVIEATGEDNLEDPDLEVVEDIEKSKVKSLQVKLKACQEEKMTHLDNLQRAKAEFLNVRKRLEEEKLASINRTENDCIEKLLPLCDSFSMAMHNEEAWLAIDESWRKGVESINSQLQQILKSYQVEMTGQVGEHFDPTLHEALGSEVVEDKNMADTVVKVIQSGYERKIGDKAISIRPARVIVGTLN